MTHIVKGSLAAVAATLLLASAASAAVGPEGKCEASKNQESGKYAFCLHKAEAKLLKTKGACSVTTTTACYRDEDCPLAETCVKDTTKYGEAVTKCEAKYEEKWDKLTQKAIDAGSSCPDLLLEANVKGVIDECVSNVAAGLAGDGLDDCTGDLATCNAALGTCPADLATCVAEPKGQRVRTGQTLCYDAAGTVIACAGTGQDGELLKGLTVSFTDNSDGTITDDRTGLMWEKISDDGSIHDKDTTYTWINAFTKIATLNGGGRFAGHTDWRLPNINELQSLSNYGAVNPAVHAPFNTGCAAACTVLTCSCTQSSGYWSATT